VTQTYLIRLAGDHDEEALEALAEIDSAEPLEHPILIGEVDGRAVAALDLDTGRTIANPFLPTAAVLVHLRMRAAAIDDQARRPGVADRLREALSPFPRGRAEPA
jgi:hypothetical protein